ncbi:aldehyde dehydrogenase family protein [Aurantiacibacter rhizosphaerae]|uniref:Aldehyde dehydrogenase family protein n=1 Tax=Aurantiacibacter rhizosphaerae TaxID=2691582 RepID=A0A844XAJ1_9SPHN|nr:aldehyde dehydrogenase family protein [Aurantiacibacter rhizosphaerae]MWV26840.1 aldehyde dehydrogenase family protein [Aurantiacibacter rhizosphaerae]
MNMPVDISILDDLRKDLSARSRELFIGGKFQPAASGETFAVIDPATGEEFASVASGDAQDIDLAVKSARKCFDSGAWSGQTPAQRARALTRLADLVEANGSRIALTETLDNGMPMMMAFFGGVSAASEQLRYNAGWATKLNGETFTPSNPGEWHAFTTREPVGVVGAIVPWNFPFVMAVAKIAPALAAGCTVVLKPAEQTPLSAVILAELIAEAGFPEGAVNIVTGYGKTAGAALVEHPLVDKISFTGSTATGKGIVHACTDNLKRVTLELGGKSPVVIFGDADLSKAIPGTAMGIFGNAGQVCAAGSRLFVHESVRDEVMEGLAGFAKSLKLGSGLSPETQMGPLVSQVQFDRVSSYIDSATSEGATTVTGGGAASVDGSEGGYFMQPTVLADTAPGMKAVEEEIFGPVLCTQTFGDDDLEQVAAAANNTSFGLSSAIWTRDMSSGLKLAKRIRAGMVRINGGAGGPDPAMPLGGFKQSGWGRENGRNGIEAYTEIKSVTINL